MPAYSYSFPLYIVHRPSSITFPKESGPCFPEFDICACTQRALPRVLSIRMDYCIGEFWNDGECIVAHILLLESQRTIAPSLLLISYFCSLTSADILSCIFEFGSSSMNLIEISGLWSRSNALGEYYWEVPSILVTTSAQRSSRNDVNRTNESLYLYWEALLHWLQQLKEQCWQRSSCEEHWENRERQACNNLRRKRENDVPNVGIIESVTRSRGERVYGVTALAGTPPVAAPSGNQRRDQIGDWCSKKKSGEPEGGLSEDV